MQSIQEKITNDIETTLAAIATPDYDFTPGGVEQERVVSDINDRYPFVEITGPDADVQFGKHTRGDLHKLEYVITYTDDISDNDVNSDPLPKRTSSVVANLHKALMVDYARSGNAIMTRPLNYGHSIYLDENNTPKFEVFLVIEVEAMIDTFDMSLKG